ncbi:MAG: LPP20 family lipoprotein [Nitrospirae bacterium]|nr:LPP20 family lipoprotein [Nitrospirota bacterium]
MLIRPASLSILVLLMVLLAGASAGQSTDNIYKEYPKDKFLVGTGETAATGKPLNDKRVAEVLARLEIAKQIKVRLKEETVDIMCEGSSARLFKDILQCRNEFIMVVEVTVDEFLEGSKIVNHWEKDGTVYAVAVMPKAEAVKELDSKVKESADKAKGNIEKAKKGDKEAAQDAQEEYMKAVTYDKEKEMLDGVRSNAANMFEELEKELVKLGGGQ